MPEGMHDQELEKTRHSAGFCLFDLCFFVDHVLSDSRVKFPDLHLLRMEPTIFGRRVIVTGAS